MQCPKHRQSGPAARAGTEASWLGKRPTHRLGIVALTCVLVLGFLVPTAIRGQTFQVDEIQVFSDGRLEFRFPVSASAYYRLFAGDEVGRIDQVVQLALEGPLSANAHSGASQRFFRIEQVPRGLSRDTDSDGLPDLYELSRDRFDPLDRLDALLDFDGDSLSNISEFRGGTDPEAFDTFALTVLSESSPANGESNVALTRETIVRLSNPLSANTVMGTNALFAEFGGRRILFAGGFGGGPTICGAVLSGAFAGERAGARDL